MSSSGIIITAILIGISIYDFNILKKSKLKITKCVSSALITLVFNLVLLGIGALIGSAIFGSNNDYWIIISLILISGISYFRFKGREISKGKIKTEKSKKKNYLQKNNKLKQLKLLQVLVFLL